MPDRATLRRGLFSFLLLTAVAKADESAYPEFHFDGFGTLGFAHSTEHAADFTRDLTQAEGAGHSHELAFGVDSRLGLQVTGEFSNRLSAIVQVIAEQDHEGDYDAVLEWANIGYDVTPNLSVRVGRTVLSTLMISDFRKVGYANHWVRPPSEVYGLITVTSNDGLDARYEFDAGATRNQLQVHVGGRDVDFPGLGTFKARDALGVSGKTQFGGAVLRGAYVDAELTAAGLDPFFDAFSLFGPPGESIADRYELDRTKVEIFTVGGQYEPGDWVLKGEWIRTNGSSFLGDHEAWYVSGAYNYGSVTPYVTVARREQQSVDSDPGLNLATLPPDSRDMASFLNQTLNTILNADDYGTVSLGARWDFASQFSLKFQFDHIRLDDGSQGALSNVQPEFRPGGSFNVLSATIDFVF